MVEENQVLSDHEVFPDQWEIKVHEALKVPADQSDNVGSLDLWDRWANLVKIVIMVKLRLVLLINMIILKIYSENMFCNDSRCIEIISSTNAKEPTPWWWCSRSSRKTWSNW